MAVVLPDGSKRHFDQPVTVEQVAAMIGTGLAKAAIAGKVDGKLVDLSYLIETDVSLEIITNKSDEALEIMRHSCSHLMAQAVKELFPDAQVTIGPVIENGFYYDFSYKRPFTPEDLALIEAKMTEIAKRDLPLVRKTMSRDDAVAYFSGLGEKYKAEIIASIPANETLSLYEQGDFTDLCRGPHVPSTGAIKVFKLMKLAGAYWRGDAKNEMLQRIYGTAWFKKEDLDLYLHRLEEAEKRDHRKLGRQMHLFHMQDEAPGMVFWHPKGWEVWQIIEQYLRKRFAECGYEEIRTPQIMDRVLWEKSGHWENYRENMFQTDSEKRDYAVKPMSCPGHIQVFNQGLKSYRDLPLRYAEFGICHRNEPSGALHGIMRVRGFVQDDAHIFCTEAQVQNEVCDFIDLLRDIYKDFGFNDILVKLSTRPEKRVGAEELWDRAEEALASALKARSVEYELQPGEGAFYGPKVEFALKDCLDRVWQCGTIQLDFSLPQRLGAEYIGEDNDRHVPVMLHRAILGSMERFIGILIEHYAGAFPVWLSPVQVVIMTISDQYADYAKTVSKKLRQAGIRVETDLRNEKITYKIREHSLQKIPYLLIVGEKEQTNQTVSVRARGNQELGALTVDNIIHRICEEVEQKR